MTNTQLTYDNDNGGIGAFLGETTVGVGRVAPDGHFLQVTPGLCRLLGYSRHALLSKTISQITHPDDRAREADPLEQLLCGNGVSYDIEKRYLRCDGGFETVNETSAAVRNTDGVLLHRIVVMSVRGSRQIENLVQAALESAGDCVLLVNSQGQIALVNSQTEKTFGYRREELLGHPVEILVPELGLADQEEQRGTNWSYQQALWPQRERRTYARSRDGAVFSVTIKLNHIESESRRWVLLSISCLSEPAHLDEADAVVNAYDAR